MVMQYFFKLPHRQPAVVATLGDKFLTNSAFLSQKFNSLNFSRFFQLSHHLCEGGYTCNFRHAMATRQFSKKMASPS